MSKIINERQIKNIKITDSLYLCIRETQYSDEREAKVDIRTKVDAPDLKYYTKRGFRISKKLVPDLILGLNMLTDTKSGDGKNGHTEIQIR